MGTNISIYLSDDALHALDVAVEKQAAADRAAGLAGRQVASRSKLIEQLIAEHVASERPLTREEITFHVVNLAKEYGAASVSLFGSYARGEATASSDVDILLEKGGIKGVQVFDFQDELSELLDRPVDVVTTAGASQRFLANIMKDAVVLYEAN